ncbi:MAG TPA: hypothetical protein EYQ18_25130 [Candidatus Handelsmanbacteria bacterium]|nr:hypothetical protein [Candidatus Handelsmanbacteria bacterium]
MKMIDYNQPFELLPNRVWRTYKGGAMLDQMQGGEGEDGHFPEDWVGSATRAANMGREDLPDEGVGRARGGDAMEYTMEALYQGEPDKALGAAHVKAYGAQPYLLVKLLDAAMRLHIQAHPSAVWAKQHLAADSGKTEAWWILGARQEEAWVYMGFQHPPTPAQWKRIIDEQDLPAMAACFEKVPVKAGDVLLVEGGVPHAIGPGVLMVEIQEPTDYVVRCEYAHGGLQLPESARTMGLGLDRVLDVFDYTEYPLAEVKARFGPQASVLREADGGREEVLLGAPQTDRLELRRVECKGVLPLATDGRFSILIVLEGEGWLRAGGRELVLKPWSCYFLPACLADISLQGALSVALCLPPRSPNT